MYSCDFRASVIECETWTPLSEYNQCIYLVRNPNMAGCAAWVRFDRNSLTIDCNFPSHSPWLRTTKT